MENIDQQKNKKKKWHQKLANKYRLIFLDEQNYEERFSIRISRVNVLILAIFILLIVFFSSFLLIAHTSLKEYIPGYTEVEFRHDMYDLLQRADSLENELQTKTIYLHNIRLILEDSSDLEYKYSIDSLNPAEDNNASNYTDIIINPSPEDSLLRTEYEMASRYNLRFKKSEELYSGLTNESEFLFYTPVKGTITNFYDPINKHFGVDIVAGENEPVLATLDGTVIFSDWTTQTGYVIAIQHRHDFISIYKHNAVLLKKQGDFVVAGEAIAIVGESGEISTGPHLHFEVWYQGKSMNPSNFLSF